MTNEEIGKLRNITSHMLTSSHVIYRYAYGIQTGITKIRYPLCITDSLKSPRYRVFDYSEVSTMILNKSSYLTYVDVAYSYDVASSHAKRYYIDELTFEQVQEIINNNIQLFAKVNERLQQDLLLAKLLQN